MLNLNVSNPFELTAGRLTMILLDSTPLNNETTATNHQTQPEAPACMQSVCQRDIQDLQTAEGRWLAGNYTL